MTVRELHDTTPWWVKMLIPIIISGILSGAITFTHQQQTGQTNAQTVDADKLGERVSKLEAHRIDDKGDITEIKSTVKDVKTDVSAIYRILLDWEGKRELVRRAAPPPRDANPASAKNDGF